MVCLRFKPPSQGIIELEELIFLSGHATAEFDCRAQLSCHCASPFPPASTQTNQSPHIKPHWTRLGLASACSNKLYVGYLRSFSLQISEYLLQHYGTVNLVSRPSMDDAEPYNWPFRERIVNSILVAFHAMMGTFIAAAIIPAHLNISLDSSVSIQGTFYLL
ncbi:hypothetical protein RU639_013660 [Aspergillus parasiticus]